MPRLSIIVPVYNTPTAMLERCFASFSSLTALDWEAVIIDDGSGPETGEFCRQYAEAHPAFRCFRQENGGVSSARNFGIDRALGDYIMFVDADDELLGEAIRDPGSCDLTVYDIIEHTGSQERLLPSLTEPEGPVTREQLLFHLITSKRLNSPCVKLFRRALLQTHNIRFDRQFVSGEDWMFVCDFVLNAETAHYIPKSCYRYYRETATGSSRVARFPDKILDNQLDRFDRKCQVAQNCRSFAQGQLLSPAAAELIENLFNTATDLLAAGQWTGPRKKRLRSAAVRAGAYLTPPVRKKTRLKLFVLRRMPFALRPLSFARRCYLQCKG